MKACFVFAIVLMVTFAAFAQSEEVASNEDAASNEQVHVLEKRQIRLPGCQLWECNSNCIRRGFKGGYCAFTGCSCY